ncbi:YbgC/FadM family acyl-CoA thioesterase [Bartonella tamiae]|uniref:Tol-pal system-associated acyl-CoA thioesterase n=1 Tax=Bartonella tamiae Th239 TaxID=1094558 RepID=J1K3M0_9HYPH|nr:YbgC/FadM family acyl-CoA thioesterase [Bartonella tamiae]EJF91740.1 tol-pal system-associated acyl-CoA thioesterase [Bartonella tamiae Th239]EJF92592.1 tol-pal system-associated acyl-CoA thioesterase [Bartonella tamiae Th307]
MTENVAFSGTIVNGVHRLDARVYFADTDFSGVVYHGRYLEFLERGRSEFLRVSNIHHHALAQGILGEKIVWIVRKMTIDFKKPAYIDDHLIIETRIDHMSGARIEMAQSVLCQEQILVFAHVDVALINDQGRPRRFPKDFIEKWQPYIRSIDK